MSFGLQSTNDATLLGLGRRRVPRAAETIAAAVAEAGFGTWNLDLIFGAPAESDDHWNRTLEDVLGLDNPPPHLSAYALTVEPGTPLASDARRHPEEDALARRYERADAVLEAAGYRWEEISNWARPGHECRHNHLYWEQGDYLGIGSAAHSHRQGVRWWNVRTPERYLAAIEGGRPAEGGREDLTADRARVRGAHAGPAHPARRPVVVSRATRRARRSRGRRGRPRRADRAGPPPGQRGQRQNPLRYPAPMSETSGAASDDLMEKVVRLCRHRGFIFPSAEIYGGFRSTYDYGPLGVNMLRNVKNAWWRAMVQERDDVVGLDAAILGPPAVWAASGHLATFTDPLVDCKNCHERWRADKIEGVCPNCGSHDLTEARAFNLMFKTHAGPVEDEGHVAYLRPETAQGMFTNFANVLGTTRKKPPFGIAQVGKSFRNEITPQNFVFRTREFEQMELEYFVPPDQGDKWFDYWLSERMQWYLDLGIPAEQLRLRHHEESELSHYSRGTADVEFLFPWGWDELEGIANRGDFDLTRPRQGVGGEARLLRPPDQRALHAVRDRAGGGRHPDDDGLPPLRLRRGRGGRRVAHRAAPRTGGSLRTRWPSCRSRRRTPSSRWPARCSRRSSPISCATTTSPRASASATAARTRWARRGASPSTSTRSRTTR